MKPTGVRIGPNRTGIALSPIHAKELIDDVRNAPPDPPGDETMLDAARIAFAEESDNIGSIPPPASMKGALGTVVKAAKGESMSVFLDKLGERLAFERTGTRLYEALSAKLKAWPASSTGPKLEDVLQIHDEELAHFELLHETMKTLGGDPTSVTPSADVTAVIAAGLPQVLTDPRTTVDQCLQAILVAELADNDGWTLLVSLADRLGHGELANRFRTCLSEEVEHLRRVRTWVIQATFLESGVVRG